MNWRICHGETITEAFLKEGIGLRHKGKKTLKNRHPHRDKGKTTFQHSILDQHSFCSLKRSRSLFVKGKRNHVRKAAVSESFKILRNCLNSLVFFYKEGDDGPFQSPFLCTQWGPYVSSKGRGQHILKPYGKCVFSFLLTNKC